MATDEDAGTPRSNFAAARLEREVGERSDLYLLFNEERGEPGDPRALRSRGFAVKLSYLLRF